VPRLLTTAEVCRLWRVSRHSIRRAVEQGRLHPVRLTRRGRARFWSDEVAKLVEDQLSGTQLALSSPPICGAQEGVQEGGEP